MSTDMNDVLDAALAYARGGYRVFPVDEDKKPLIRWKDGATLHAREIRWYWHRWPHALIGLCTGDGLVVIDDDRGGEKPEPDLAITRTARTRSRGWHHYFTCDRTDIGNRVGLIPGVDVRGQGGYVVAPPSPGWEWLNDGVPLPLPEWVVTIMTADRERSRFGPGFTPRTPANPVAEGGRNDYLARFVGWYLRHFPEDPYVLEAVRVHNGRACVPPLPDAEVKAVVNSIMRRHRS